MLELHVRNIVTQYSSLEYIVIMTRLRLCYCVARYHKSFLPLPGQDH